MAATLDTSPLPLGETKTPTEQAEVAAVVRSACEQGVPIYPLGGETALDYGLPPKTPGTGLSLRGLDRVVDYPARDMTVTVEAGITLDSLAELLGANQQWLPVDAPDSSRATIGGIIATNTNGPRRYGQGTIRDYVIGIAAVDGQGTPFHGGGRVVKNVAGYDFCKLLTGSLGTLAVITQVTLKVKPGPAATALISCDLSDLETAEQMLGALVCSETTPTAIELLAGPAWHDDPQLGPQPTDAIARLVVGLEGTAVEVGWMVEQLVREWKAAGIASIRTVTDGAAGELWQRLIEFQADRSPTAVLRANLVPSGVVRFCQTVLEIDGQASVQAHAGNGIVTVRLGGLAPHEVAPAVIKRLQPAAVAAYGSLTLLSAKPGVEVTRQLVWGPARGDHAIMMAVKRQFDPRGILNPGRFVMATA